LSVSVLRCAGCGAAPAIGDPYGWVCPNARSGDDVDHVMVHCLEGGVPLVMSDHENPFVRYRGMLHSYHRWIDAGRDDSSFVALVEGLDDAVAKVESEVDRIRRPSDSTSSGGFRRTPLVRAAELDASAECRVWVKDETGNVSGSHKGRHLFGLMILLRVVEELGLVGEPAPLAIASCGNAALAAAVVAAAAGRELEVFVPVDAEPSVVTRLASLGSRVTVCPRGDGAGGDPCYRAFHAAVDAGAVPFGCQGPDNGLTIDGGQTLAWELAEALPGLDRLVVQVGGGALASACIQGLGVLPRMPVVDTVQTTGASPLARAYARVVDLQVDGRSAARHRSRYMWPWGTAPASVARGILDDETYDWRAVVDGMLATGGSAVVAEESTLAEANRLARAATGIDVDATGSAGLAGLLTLSRSGLVEPGTDVVVIFSGAAR